MTTLGVTVVTVTALLIIGTLSAIPDGRLRTTRAALRVGAVTAAYWALAAGWGAVAA